MPADLPAFTGPPLRILALRNADQWTRYPFTDPCRFLREVQRLWGSSLDVTVVDERQDPCRRLEAIGEYDALVLLSNSTHNRVICESLVTRRETIGSWVEDGGALCVLHTGSTHRPDFLPPSVDVTYEPLEDPRRAKFTKVVPRELAGELKLGEHPIARAPYPPDTIVEARHPVFDYHLRYKRAGGPFVHTSPAAISDSWGPLVVAGQVGAGRTAISPLPMDWHGFAPLFVNVLAWVCRVPLVEASGEAVALVALPPTGRVRFGVTTVHGSCSDEKGRAKDIGDTGALDVVLHAPNHLEIKAGTLVGIADSVLTPRLVAGLWEHSAGQTIEICRYLVEAGADDVAAAAIGQLERHYSGCIGENLITRLHGLALASHPGAMAERRPATRSQVEQDLKRPATALIDEGSRVLVALERSGETKLAERLAAELADELGRTGTGIAASAELGAAPTEQLRRYTLLRGIDQFVDRARQLPVDSAQPPPLDELLAARPPTEIVLDFLEIGVLGRPRDELEVSRAYFDCLLVYAFADFQHLGMLSSTVLIARHVAFWSEQPSLRSRAGRLVAAAALLERSPEPDAIEDTQARLVRERLGEAYDILNVPDHDRDISRPLAELLAGATTGSLAHAAAGLLSHPVRRTLPTLKPLVRPVLGAGSLALVPLFAKDSLQTFVVTSPAVRWSMGIVLLLAALATAWYARLSRTLVLIAAVVLLGWMVGVIELASSNFASDVARWTDGNALTEGGLQDVLAAVEAAFLPWSVVFLVAVLGLAATRERGSA